jgi:hypothetical protein
MVKTKRKSPQAKAGNLGKERAGLIPKEFVTGKFDQTFPVSCRKRCAGDFKQVELKETFEGRAVVGMKTTTSHGSRWSGQDFAGAN